MPKFAFRSFYKILRTGYYRLYTARFIFNKNIIFGKNNQIGKNVIIKNNAGGKITIGDNNIFMPGVILLSYGGSIAIGDNCNINPYTIIYGHGKGTKIGNNVLIAGQSMIIPANHVFVDKLRPISEQGTVSKGIIIEDDVWIGAGCTILDGVKISRGSIVAAGSVVNKSTIPFSIVGGVPAKTLKMR